MDRRSAAVHLNGPSGKFSFSHNFTQIYATFFDVYLRTCFHCFGVSLDALCLSAQVFWGYLLVRVLFKLIVNGHVEDDRSDDEAEEDHTKSSDFKKKAH